MDQRKESNKQDRPSVRKLSEHIYAVESPYDEVFVLSYVVAGDSVVLIDTGLVNTGEVILELLESLGRPGVVAAILTHGHWDHIGSVATARNSTGCVVAAHRDDAPMISSYAENDRRFLHRFPELVATESDRRAVHDRLGPECHVDLLLTGGERFDLGRGVVLEIVPMPGHTPGSIGVFERESGTLFAGDGLAGRGTFGTLAQYESVAEYRATIRRLKELPIRQLLSAHFEPMDEQYARQFLNDCLDETERIDVCVQHAYENPADLVSTAQKVCRHMGKPFLMQTLMTLTAHLEDMKRSGN